MCGIAGILNLDGRPAERAGIQRMVDSLAHRGPDGEGLFVEGALGLGHRRLAILDLGETGRQPMPSEGGRFWITYNGEVYNFVELANELESCGVTFASASDTEVILAAFARWGVGCLDRFNGMWAFAIWDRQERELFLARDRFGVKPLFFARTPDRFIFASEIKAILQVLPGRPEVNLDALYDALSGLTPDLREETLYRGVFLMPAGTWIRVSQDGRVVQERWWQTLDHLPAVPKRESEQVERYRELFTDAVRVRLRSDVPIGSLLSGGIDSSSIVSCIASQAGGLDRSGRFAPDWQRTFTAEYPGLSADEMPYAQAVLNKFGLAGTRIRPKPESLGDLLQEMVRQQDVPVDQSLFAVHSVYKAVGETGTKVTLDGQGADESLLGYGTLVATRSYLRRLRLVAALQSARAHAAIGPNLERIPTQLWRIALAELSASFRPRAYARRLLGLPTPAPAEPACGAPSAELLARVNGDAYRGPDGLDLVTSELYRQLHHSPLPPILRRFDHAAMAYSVESRMPFMDWRLITYTLGLPVQMKVGGGWTKRVLRLAMKGTVPDKVLSRRSKLGFPIPPEWFADPAVQSWCRSIIEDPSFARVEFWNGARLAAWFAAKSRDNSWTGQDSNTLVSVASTFLWLGGTCARAI